MQLRVALFVSVNRMGTYGCAAGGGIRGQIGGGLVTVHSILCEEVEDVVHVEWCLCSLTHTLIPVYRNVLL